MNTLAPVMSAPRRGRWPAVAAVLGLLLAVGWFATVRVLAANHADAAQAERLARGAQLVALLRETAQRRVKTSARVLAQDTRLQAAVGLAEADRLTVNDLLQDLQQLDPEGLFALFDPTGRVIAALGARQLEGLDLSSSAAVKGALQAGDAATSAWVVDERVVELAVSPIVVGERLAGLLGVGVRVEDASLATVARAAGVQLALVVDGRPAWTSALLPDSTWRTAPTAVVAVNDGARYVVASPRSVDDAVSVLAWAVPLTALLFAVLAFSRRGAS